ncbi:U2 snRNP component prp10 [Tilletia horrida]|nr:U2 snRNP component prp10 [Tilletia horrida]
MGKDYANSVVTLLEDALSDRDHVHRQTAAAIVKHIAFGVVGLGQEEALQHLLNLVWPDIFETSPHLIGGIVDAIEGTLGRVAGTPRLWPACLSEWGHWPCFKAEDQQYFDKILKPEDDLNSGLTVEGLKDRKILCLLLTFELLDLLKALKRAIRRAAVNSFSHVAKAIGPQDVVQVLLNHLHMQERQCSVYAQQSPLPS